MITFKQQITVPEELVTGLALELGWRPSYSHEDNEGKEIVIENTQTAEEFIDLLSKQHTMNFFVPFGLKLVEQEIQKLGFDQQKEQARIQIIDQIIQPVKNALVTEIIINE